MDDKEFVITKDSLLKFFKTNSVPTEKYKIKQSLEFNEELTERMLNWWIKHFISKEQELPAGETGNGPENVENGELPVQAANQQTDSGVAQPVTEATLNLEQFRKGMKAKGFKDLLKSVIAAKGIGK